MEQAPITTSTSTTIGAAPNTLPDVDRRPLIYAIIAAVIIAGGTFALGHYIGYRHGYDAGYIPEHSHFVFQKARADTMAKSIARQKGCINRLAKSVPPVTDSGLVALGETMRAIGLMYWGTVACNEASGFGYLTQEQVKSIIPSSDNE